MTYIYPYQYSINGNTWVEFFGNVDSIRAAKKEARSIFSSGFIRGPRAVWQLTDGKWVKIGWLKKAG